MNWIRHRATRGSGRSTLLLSSVLALLALACFPVFAQASGSGTVVYDPSLPNPGDGPTQNEKIAKPSSAPNNGSAEAPTNTSESYTEEVPSSEGAATAGNGNGDGTGQGKADKGSNPTGKAKVQDAAPIAKSAPATSSDDDGSSPLVPILVAILALAAISIAVVMVRQRRQGGDSGSSLSTKAG
jgi:cobalamin biosynthesis Mg chelatase CobN